ncbi:ATP-binding protein [Aurantimonas endophytica]|uniref:histidine kinase n=1 Tax=Aurantimonas endophytica TaxID=1522175 RepID=A0A7W6MRV9_9HYPH|nr:two-component system sensor histidine kinase AdeS [Aurantimonas endophytica]
MLSLILAVGLLAATAVGWRLTQTIAAPLRSVGAAARRVAGGDFSARAVSPASAFEEGDSLVADFNAMAERLEKAESELAFSNSSIAHELRTPLTILRGRLQGLLDGTFEPSPKLYTRLIAQVDDLAAIVEELRTLALSSAGKLELTLGPVDLAREAETVLASIEADLIMAGIGIERQLRPALTQADAAKIRQALLAILENCRRYAPGSTVRVETGVADDHVVLRCRDTGPGLSPEERERAFERFWRADESRARARGGSGLGLSVVLGIARAHGGEAVILDDVPGFAIELRLPRAGSAKGPMTVPS